MLTRNTDVKSFVKLANLIELLARISHDADQSNNAPCTVVCGAAECLYVDPHAETIPAIDGSLTAAVVVTA